MYKATLAIKPMNNAKMVVTYKGGDKRKANKPKSFPIKFGKYNSNHYIWDDKLIVECISKDNDLIKELKKLFLDFGLLGVDMSNFDIEDNGTYFEGICWGEYKNVHFWFEVEELT